MIEDLKFTPRAVKEIEDRVKLPFTDVLSAYSMTNIYILVEKALGKNETEAGNWIEAYLKIEGNELMKLYIEIMEKLQEGGFLPKALNLKEQKEKLMNPEAFQSNDILVSTGNQEKKQQ